MHDLAPLPSPGALISYEQAEAESVRRYQAAEKAASTRRAYRSDIKAFSLWCLQRGLCACPASPDTVCRFLSHGADAGLSASSLGRRIASIAYMDSLKAIESPTSSKAVKITIAGIRNEIGTAPRKKIAATHDLIQRMLDVCPTNTTIGVRDRALISLGFAGAFRRSELPALRV
jgi:site-specific recombinase XerD